MVKWTGARWLLAPYELGRSTWDFGYEAGRIASSLAGGNGFTILTGNNDYLPTAWLSPAYPLMLSWVFRSWGAYSSLSAQVAVAGNCLFQACTAVLLYRLGLRLGGRTTGFLAVSLFLLNPGGWHFLAWAGPSQLLALALLAHVALLVRADSGGTAVAALCGASLAAALLVDGVAIAILPVTALVIWSGARKTGSAQRALAAALVSLVLVLTPWALRNQRDLGVLNPLRGIVGVNLWVGNHPGASEESFHGMLESPWHNRSEGRRLVELGEAEYDRQSRQRAVAQAASEPAAFAVNSAMRFSGFWFAEWWAAYDHIAWHYTLGHIALTALACAGAWRARRRGIGFTVVAALLFALPYAVTIHDHGRYRVPIEPILCLLAALIRQPTGNFRATSKN